MTNSTLCKVMLCDCWWKAQRGDVHRCVCRAQNATDVTPLFFNLMSMSLRCVRLKSFLNHSQRLSPQPVSHQSLTSAVPCCCCLWRCLPHIAALRFRQRPFGVTESTDTLLMVPYTPKTCDTHCTDTSKEPRLHFHSRKKQAH